MCRCVCVESWMCVGFKGETVCGWKDCFLCVYGEMGVWVERDRVACVSVCIEIGVCVERASRACVEGEKGSVRLGRNGGKRGF